MARTYGDDPRFKAYYDSLAEGCAVFLRDAVRSIACDSIRLIQLI